MKVLISGSRGLVGAALTIGLKEQGIEVRPLVRGEAGDGIWWNPATGELNASALEKWNPDALVHLAGENIAAGYWTAAQKRRIGESRGRVTERLVRSLARLEKPPIFLCASAVGYYGDRGEEVLTEESGPGAGFLAEVATAWERAAKPLSERGVRVVHLRFGMILSAQGGALKKMLPLFKLGLGGTLGGGRQWMSWIGLRDVVKATGWLLRNERAQGAYNVVAQPVRNRDFTAALARVLGRPAVLPVPAFALRLALGEMAQALLLASQRAVPQKLAAEGFEFEHPELEGALRVELR